MSAATSPNVLLLRSKREISVSSQKQEKLFVFYRMIGVLSLFRFHDFIWPQKALRSTYSLFLINRQKLTARILEY